MSYKIRISKPTATSIGVVDLKPPAPPPPVTPWNDHELSDELLALAEELEQDALYSRFPNSLDDIQQIVTRLSESGWNVGATVARLNPPAGFSGQSVFNSYFWGMIQHHRRYYDDKSEYYRPLAVKWFDGTTTNEHPNDLFLVAKAPPQSETNKGIANAIAKLKK